MCLKRITYEALVWADDCCMEADIGTVLILNILTAVFLLHYISDFSANGLTKAH